MDTPLIVLVAALAMVAQDVVSTVMVMAESHERGWLAGWCDTIAWLVGITTTTISVTALQGNDMPRKIAVVVFVSAANLLGTKLGQQMGSRLMSSVRMRTLFSKGSAPKPTLEERVSALESR